MLAGDGTITGLVDFGDMHHTAAVCDLAVTLTSVLRTPGSTRPRPVEPARPSSTATNATLARPAEADLLGELVLARLVDAGHLGARVDEHPDNNEYISQDDGTR